MQRTPSKLHEGVLRLCARINPASQPVFVPNRAEPDALPRDCFPNVRRKISRDGGALVHGWAISEVPSLFIEAEFHGVWQSPGGDLIDVSILEIPGNRILFLPDPGQNFDEATFNRRDNVRLALLDHPTIHAFIECCEDMIRYQEQCTDPLDPSRMRLESNTWEAMLARKTELAQQMMTIPLRGNAECPCCSGRKYKHCCGK